MEVLNRQFPFPAASPLLVVAALLLNAPPTAAIATDPPPRQDVTAWEKDAPPVPLPGREPARGSRGYDVVHYELDLDIDPGAETVAGEVAVHLAAVGVGLESVVLDLVQDLGVDDVRWNGAAAAFVHAGDSLTIALPVLLPAGESGVLRVRYGGRPRPHGPLAGGLLFRSRDPGTPDDPDDDRPVVFSIVEPSSAHAWWPCKDHPGDKATATLSFTVPEDMVAVSNGRLLGAAPAPGGRRRFTWDEAHPLATYLLSVAAADYVHWREECRGAYGPVDLQYFVFPEDESRARADLAPTCAMLGFMEDLAGPYPFADEKYAQAAVKWGGAMEHQTATSLGSFLFTGDGRFAKILVHELAHQWFGDLITPADWPDLWLNEGFARYCEALWLERTEGRAAYLNYMRRIGPERHEDLFTEQGLLTDPVPLMPNLLVYDKGAWVLHMLRGHLGDAAFFALLRDYAGDPRRAYGNVTTADFVAAAAATGGDGAARMLAPWLNTGSVPHLSWRVDVRSRAGGALVGVTVEQLQTVVFPLVLPVHLYTAAGLRVERLHLDGRAAGACWRLDSPVDSVRVDPEGWVLKTTAPMPTASIALQAPRPNPARGPVSVRFALARPAVVTARVVDVRGRVVQRRDLGFMTADDPGAWTWDARDGEGRSAPAGAYWVVIDAGVARASRKIALLR